MAPDRPSWDRIWMDVALTIRRRSQCTRGLVGAVVVGQDNRVVSTGYNGTPASWQGSVADCPRAFGSGPKEACISVHAEANALLYGDRRTLEGGTIYVTRVPCLDCAKLIAAAKLARVVARLTGDDRHAEGVLKYLSNCGIVVHFVTGDEE